MTGATQEPRPEHREIDPLADDVVDVGRAPPGEDGLELACTECRPWRTRPVRKDSDFDSVVRCAQCGKKHSTDSLEAPIS